MGKRLIINGADFSVNGIAPEYLNLAWIGGSIHDSRDSGYPNGEFISSNVQIKLTTKIVTEFILGTTPRSFYLTGGMLSTGTAMYAWIQSNRVTVGMLYKEGTQTGNTLNIDRSLWDGQKHTLEISQGLAQDSIGGVVLDGVRYGWANASEMSSGASTFSIVYLDCIHLYNNPSSSGQHANSSLTVPLQNGAITERYDGEMKICRVKIYDDYTDPTSLLVDAIPAQRTSDRKVGFYNLVNGDWFFRNNDSTPTYGTL